MISSVHDGGISAPLDVLNACSVPIAKIDSNLNIVEKNKAFSEVFQIRRSSGISRFFDADTCKSILETDFPIVVTSHASRNPVCFVILPLFANSAFTTRIIPYEKDTRFYLMIAPGASFVHMYNSDGPSEETAVSTDNEQRKKLYDMYIKRNLSQTLLPQILDGVYGNADRSTFSKELFRLKRVELLVSSALNNYRWKTGCVGTKNLFGGITELIGKYLPENYSVAFWSDHAPERINTSDIYSLSFFVAYAVICSYMHFSTKSIGIYVTSKSHSKFEIRIAPTDSMITDAESRAHCHKFFPDDSDDYAVLQSFAKRLDGSAHIKRNDPHSISLELENPIITEFHSPLGEVYIVRQFAMCANEIREILSLVGNCFE